MIRFRPEESAGGDAPQPEPQGTPEPQQQAAPPAPSWSGPSQEEWQQTQQAINYLAQMFSEPEPEDEPENGEIDIEDYISRAVDSRLQPVRPLLDATVKERGEKEMQRIFAEMKDEVGDFDQKLAERTAQSFLSEYGGDPVEATKAGAKYAAEVRAAERGYGETSYKERLKRGPQDYEAPVEGGAVKTRQKAKSYDEVIENWSGETEV